MISIFSSDPTATKKKKKKKIRNLILVKLLSHILCYFLLLSCCTRHQLWESRKSLFYYSVLCPCFLSLFLLLFKSRTTSSSTSSAYSNIHKAPAAYHAVPSGICALHKYLFASIAVLYRQRAREGGRACTPPPSTRACACYCFLLFWDRQYSDTVAHLSAELHPSCS